MSFRMHFGSKANKKSSKSEKKFGLFKPFDTIKSDDSKDTSNALNTASTSSRSLSNPKFTVPASKSITTHHKRMHEEALAQDPSIFDYDAVYDTIHAPKPSNTSQKLSSTHKKPKYINAIMEKAKIREMEHERIRERRLQREREEEEEQYGEKEKLISASYKRKLMERKEWELEDMRLEKQEQTQDVRLRGEAGMAAFYANLTTKNIALGGNIEAATSAYTVKEADETNDKKENVEVKRKRAAEMEDAEIKQNPSEENETEFTSLFADEPSSVKRKKEVEKRSEDVIAAAKARFLARKSERQ